MMDIEDFAADAALFARMRSVWAEVDPVPVDLVDRMVAAVAVEDLSREYALLTLVETCLLLGSVFFATGLLSEQIAQQ